MKVLDSEVDKMHLRRELRTCMKWKLKIVRMFDKICVIYIRSEDFLSNFFLLSLVNICLTQNFDTIFLFLILVTDDKAPSTLGVTDKYHVFELGTPFARIEVNKFMVLLKMAMADIGADTEHVTLQALRTHFKTPAWKPLEDEGSSISKFLLSSAFK